MNCFTLSLVCFLVLLPIIFSTPPPTDPNVKVKVTSRGMTFLSTIATKQFETNWGHRDISIDMLFDGHTYGQGHAFYTTLPTIELTTIANDSPVPSFTGFKRMNLDEIHQEHRSKRRTEGRVTFAKSLYEDTDFLAGKQLGAIQAVAKGMELHSYVTPDPGKHIATHVTDANVKVTAYFGQKDGFLWLARLAVETDAVMNVELDGESYYNAQIFEDLFQQKHLAGMQLFRTQVDLMSRKIVQVLGSQFLDHVVLDTRLTEHPLFTDEGFELNMVGSFVYDEANQYTKGQCFMLDMLMGEMKKRRREGAEPALGSDSYTQDFVVFDNPPKPTALVLEGSDSEEAERKARSCFVLSVKQEMFNSMYQVLQKSRLFDLSFDRNEINYMLSRYNHYSNTTTAKQYDISALPAGTHFTLKLEPTVDGESLELYEGGARKRSSITLGFNGMLARYTLFTDVKVTFRNGKFAYDVLKMTVHKEADKEYPRIFTEESLKHIVEDYIIRYDNSLFVPQMMRHLTQFDLNDGTMTFGIDTFYE